MHTLRWARLGIPMALFPFLIGLPAHAQGRWSASVFGGAGVPVGDFSDDAGESAGLATAGFVLGSDLAIRIPAVSGLDWLSTIQGVSFGVDEGFLQDIPVAAEVDLGRYWGALLMSGLRYGIGPGPTRVQFAGQVVIGMMRAPNGTVTAVGEEFELESFWEPVKGISGGLGLAVGDRVSVDARYETFFNPEVRGELRYQGTVEELEGEQPMSWIRVTVGLRVW